MWYIERKKNPNDRIFFLTDEEYLVGRKDVKILIENDPSISRKHAQFSLSVPENSQSRLPLLTLKDLNSKYGTCVSGHPLSGTEVVLKNNDIISFGKLDCIWRIVHEPLVLTTSCLPNPDKMKLKRIVSKLGGCIVSEYAPSCNYLVMNSIMITAKTLCALASMKPIVLPSFFSDMVEQATHNKSLSDPNVFLPPVGEVALQDTDILFNPDERRPKLFKDKKFIFFDLLQERRLSPGLKLAGGTSKLLNIDDLDNFECLVEDDVCVLSISGGSSTQCSADISQNPNIHEVMEFLKRKKKRFVSESEIALAIVHSSIEKYCNPDFKLGALFFGDSTRIQLQSLTQQSVMAPETQLADSQVDISIRNPPTSRSGQNQEIVMETHTNTGSLISNFGNGKNRQKRPLPQESCQSSISKKQKTDAADNADIFMKGDITVKQEVCTDADPSNLNVSGNFFNTTVNSRDQSKKVKIPEAAVDENATNTKESYENNEVFINTVHNQNPIQMDRKMKCETEDAEAIPNNVLKIKYVDLIDRQKPKVCSTIHTNGINFKKFKRKHMVIEKTFPELVPYVKTSDKLQDLDNWRIENGIESQKNDNTSDVEDKFNWDEPIKRKKRAKRI